jgi:hypothetical protein
VVKHLPDYISRVDQKGYFRINNVNSGIYRLYALTDGDNSKNYNFPEEEFAFMNSLVEITPGKNFIPVVKDTVKVKKEVPKIREKDLKTKKETKIQDTIVPIGEFPLILFAAKKTNHYLTSSVRPSKYQLNYTLSIPPDDTMDFRFRIQDIGESSYFIEKNREKDSITVWLTDTSLFSQSLISSIVDYPFTDTLGITGYKQDTIGMRFLAPRPTRGAKIKKTNFVFESNIKANALKPGQQIVFSSGTPFREPDTSKIQFYQIADSLRLGVKYNLIKDSLTTLKYHLKADLAVDKKYLIIADSASFGNIYNENSDSVGFSNCRDSCIIQLLDKQEKLVNEALLNSDGKVVFPLLDAGVYRIKVIYDLDGDGKWTTGDFDKGRQPEPVSYYPNEIELKTGWEAIEDWDIGKQFFKEQKLKSKKTLKK